MPQVLTKRKILIGPEDDGRRMSLADFDKAEVVGGHLYELGRGVIAVSDVPNLFHALVLQVIRDLLVAYRLRHLDLVRAVFGGAECKILMPGFDSERHPDVAVYLTDPPDIRADLWMLWIPDIAVEVVSRRSGERDYEEKREEYLAMGVREYWIVDPFKLEILILRRYGDQWREQIVKAAGSYRTPLLPGFTLSARKVFAPVKKGRK